MRTSTVSSLLLVAVLAGAYPVTYTNCGVQHVVDQAPQRAITMTQGATEFLLALGLANQMVGTAYLDDYIWPKYATEYSKIPVLSSGYPNETTILGASPDFVIASFNSAFRQKYESDTGPKGIFSKATFGKNCTGAGGVELGMSEIASNDRTCRKELNSIGIGTFLFQDACENKSLRPDVVSEEVVYEEMRALGKIFKVDVEHLITDMRQDFDSAQSLVSTNMHGTPLKAVWLDCVGRCCPVDPGQEPEVYVGVKSGVPGMLMQEAGLTNLFAHVEGSWACVKESDVIAAAPDVIVVVDAAWDTALGKLTWLYNHSAFCDMDALKAARLVQIPFSATSLSPRNGAAALDLANAALHVRMGTATHAGESGVGSFNPGYLRTQTAGLRCSLDMPSVVYAPVTYTNCGVEHVVDKAPQRVITMTQGATEFLLALGLAKQMVGTAYLDDYIWPKYASEYSKIPVLSSGYPNETTILGASPDFVVASFNSAFRQKYESDTGPKGIFSKATFGKNCTGAGGVELGMSEIASNDRTCRKELNSIGIGTFLFQDACENKALRPDVVSEEIVYEEMRALGKIFKVEVEHLITEMRQDFDSAQNLISTRLVHGTSLKTVWLDCVGRCCPVDPGQEPEVFVGVKSGVPGMLMQEAGLSNVFAHVEGNWACVKESDVVAAAPDVIVVVDAAWDTALGKITWLYNHSAFCGMDALKEARLVQIPFSATSLSPRNGAAALDLAAASLHVRLGTATPTGESGVGSFNPGYLRTQTSGLRCGLDKPWTTTTTAAAPQVETGTATKQTKITGKVTVKIAGTTSAYVETALKKSLATKFSVDPSAVAVIATESRRLSEGTRRLAGTWVIDYAITAPEARKAAMETALSNLKANPGSLKTEIAKELENAGAGEAVANSLEVTSITGTTVTTPTEVASEACGLHSLVVWLCLALACTHKAHIY